MRLVLFAVFGLLFLPVLCSSEIIEPVLVFGGEGSGLGDFRRPQAVDVDLEGRIFVADTGDISNCSTCNNRMQVFNSSGDFVLNFSSSGAGPGRLSDAQGVFACDGDLVYVSDTDNDRIQVFNKTGEYLTTIGGYGTGAGQFILPEDVTLGPEDKIYVADTQNHRIHVFYNESENYSYRAVFGAYGSEEGYLDSPSSVAVDAFGRIHVADTDNNRTQIFHRNGTVDLIFGANLSGGGSLLGPQGIYVDGAGRIYVADSNNHRVVVFRPDGTVNLTFGALGNGTGYFNTPKDISLDDEGRIYVADTTNNRIQVFDVVVSEGPEPYVLESDIWATNWTVTELEIIYLNITVRNNGTETAANLTVKVYARGENTSLISSHTLSVPAGGTQNFYTLWQVRRGFDGFRVVVDPDNVVEEINEVNNVMDADIFVNNITQKCIMAGVYGAQGVSVDGSGTVFAANRGSNIVSLFWKNNCTHIENWGSGFLSYPSDVALDAAGRLYVADTSNSRIVVYGSNGSVADQINNSLSSPQGVWVGADGRVYVADTNNHQIKVFFANGTLDKAIGGLGSGPTQLNTPMDVILDGSGLIYVADRLNHRIQVFNTDGTYNKTFGVTGSSGSGPGYFNQPHSVAINSHNMIFVADRNNDRVQILNPDGSLNFSLDYEGHLSDPEGVYMDSEDMLYVSDTSVHAVREYNDYFSIDPNPATVTSQNPANGTTLTPYTQLFVLNISTNKNAICRYATAPTVWYDSMPYVFDVTNSTSHRKTVSGLSPNQTIDFYIKCMNPSNVFAVCDYHLRYGTAAPDVVVNEFLPNPAAGFEWIELYNRGETLVNLSGGYITYSGGSVILNDSLGSVGAGSFKLLNESDTGISLNDTGDIVLLYDRFNTLIDSISYADGQQFGGGSYNKTSPASIGRGYDGGPEWRLINLSDATPEGSNNIQRTEFILLTTGWNLISLPV